MEETKNLIKKRDFANVLLQNDFSIWYEYMFPIMWKHNYTWTKGNDKMWKYLDKSYTMEYNRLNINAPPRSSKTQSMCAFHIYCTLKTSCNFIYSSSSKMILGYVRSLIESVFKNKDFLSYYPTPYIEEERNLRFKDSVFEEDYQKEIDKNEEKNRMSFSIKQIRLNQSNIYLIPRGSILAGIGCGRVSDIDEFTGSATLDDIERTTDSDMIRDKLHQWYSSEVLSRLENTKCPIFNVHHRTSTNDMTAYLNKTYKFVTCKIPLLDEKGEVQFLKSKYNVEELKQNTYDWQRLYCQEPISKGGNYIKTEWFKNWEFLPQLSYTIMSCDTAMKVNARADYSVFMFAGVTSRGDIYIIDAHYGKWEANELVLQLRNFYAKCSHRKKESIPPPLQVFIEDKASGIGLIQSLKSFNLPVKPVNPGKKNKADRMMDVLPIIASGYVHIPAVAEWRAEFMIECEGFPEGGKKDDFVDATQQILANYKNINTFLSSL